MDNITFKRVTQNEYNGVMYPSTWFTINGSNLQFCINGDWSSEEELAKLDKLAGEGKLSKKTTVPAGKRTNKAGEEFMSAAFTIVTPRASDKALALAAKLFQEGLEQHINTQVEALEAGVDSKAFGQQRRDNFLAAEAAKVDTLIKERLAERAAAKKAAEADAAAASAASVVTPAAGTQQRQPAKA